MNKTLKDCFLDGDVKDRKFRLDADRFYEVEDIFYSYPFAYMKVVTRRIKDPSPGIFSSFSLPERLSDEEYIENST